MSKRLENLKAKKKIEPHKFIREVYFETADIFADLIRYCNANELDFKEEISLGISYVEYEKNYAKMKEERDDTKRIFRN